MRRHDIRRFALSISTITLVSFLCSVPATQLNAEEVKPVYAGGETQMNGYHLKQFGDFVRHWHFVTVRFRRDNGQMRFVYANELAWKALNKHSTDYPDGAVFAKVIAFSGEDPAFIDSAVPIRTDSIQIMVRNHTRHKDTDGWGYAIFLMDGHTVPGKPLDEVSQACNACHQAIPERGMVFAQPMPNLSPLGPPEKYVASASPASQSKITFTTVSTASLPEDVRGRLPGNYPSIRKMLGAIPQHVFQGSMFESIPLVGAEAARYGMPALLIDVTDSRRFSALWPVAENNICRTSDGHSGRRVAGIFYAVMVGSNPHETVQESHMSYFPIAPFCAVADVIPN